MAAQIEPQKTNPELEIAVAEVKTLSEIHEITQVFILPSLMINEKLVCVGRFPKKEEIIAWLQEAQSHFELREPMISKQPPAPRSLWITLEATEVIELKRIGMDRVRDETVAFFKDVLVPRVRAAARQRGIALDMLAEDENHERLPG